MKTFSTFSRAAAMTILAIVALSIIGQGTALAGNAVGTLYAPYNFAYNPTHYAAVAGSTYTAWIRGATDVSGSTINVYIKSSNFGNQTVVGTKDLSDGPNSYKFTFTVPVSGWCQTSVVAYGTNGNNIATGRFGFAFVDGSGNIIESCVVCTLAASASATPILCNGGSSTVTVSATGGTPPYVGTGSFNVGAGTYTYTVTDAKNCSASASVNISQPSALTASSSATPILCNGGSSTVSVSAEGGTPPYSGTGDFSVLAGSWSYTVTDANGCSASTSGSVGEPELLVASASAQIYICNAAPFVGGSVDLSVSGGTPPYSYLWSNGATTEDIAGLVSGSYSVVVTDGNGCNLEANATVRCEVRRSECQEDVTLPAPAICNTTGNLFASPSGYGQYIWEITSQSPANSGWAITSGANSQTVTYTAGNAGSSAVFQLIRADASGSSLCEYTLTCTQPEGHRTFTQGFYGSTSGKDCLGRTAVQIEALVLSSGGNLFIGSVGRSFVVLPGQASQLNRIMPGGGTASVLPAGSWTVSTIALKNGKINNVLLSQTIALGLNMRYDATLGSFQLVRSFSTVAMNCDGTAKLNASASSFSIPQSVLTALGANKSVADLFAFASSVLGGGNRLGASLSDINSAVDAINRGFDEGRQLVPAPVISSSAPNGDVTESVVGEESVELPKEFSLGANYPNPFNPSTMISFSLPEMSNVTLEVYNLLGQKVATLVDGLTDAGVHSVTWNAGSTQQQLASGMYIYRIQASSLTSSKSFVQMRKMVLTK